MAEMNPESKEMSPKSVTGETPTFDTIGGNSEGNNYGDVAAMDSATSLGHSISATNVVDFDKMHGGDAAPASASATATEAVTSIAGSKDDTCLNVSPASPYEDNDAFTNLCASSNNAKVLFATDEWFATADNLLNDSIAPQFVDDLYCEQGKVMDGWETRRRREAGHDWCIIQLASADTAPPNGVIHTIEIDTAHFTGNHVPSISIEILDINTKPQQRMDLISKLPHAMERLVLHDGRGIQGTGMTPTEVEQAEHAVQQLQWQSLLPKTPLQPGFESTRMHRFQIPTANGQHRQWTSGTYIRVNYYPDGGVARLRIWGTSATDDNDAGIYKRPLYMPITTGPICTVVPHSDNHGDDEDDDSTPSRLSYDLPELSSLTLGGAGIACSNKHYGEPWRLLQPTLGKDMGDGWETARHPQRPSVLQKHPVTHFIDSPLMDWSILKLGTPAAAGVARIILDTKHFRGNYPESVVLEGCCDVDAHLPSDDVEWFSLIPRVRMSPDAEHVFERSLGQIENSVKQVSHVRLSIYPDGGVSRVRIYG
uniref:Allantoicase domain-containing protein n=1 Tax=Craspedostauros australis TaxID=1486917 RepID=A0A7R9ZNR0_9STRA|eukprot:CAMPEP_0198123838 /NCGR_PEP_ID=MMETSP1442-20131203/38473_1 /TAXON_ID= /ORGANISM="Craspedostauros australis, Strain CCMP3328" /LENGTH=537 /DNA_ID=CAMNT_0043783113 /DNA_START=52 /DNA_END=1665 /DNA_ORIENTATION=-